MNNNWVKKEKPLPSMIGLGGGATGLDKSAGGAVDRATGGTITYEGGKTIDINVPLTRLPHFTREGL